MIRGIGKKHISDARWHRSILIEIGAMDILIDHLDQPVALLNNQTKTEGKVCSSNWSALPASGMPSVLKLL